MATVVVAAALAVAVTAELHDRRADGYCRRVAGTTERATWWPVGERCTVTDADGGVSVRRPGWSLTALLAVVVGGVAVGAAAPAGSARRRTAEALALPALPLAVAVAAIATPPSLSRVVAVTTVSLYLTAVPGLLSALAVHHLLATGWRSAIAGSWFAWAFAVFFVARDGVGP